MDEETLRSFRRKLIAISAVFLSGVAVYFFYVENPEPTIEVPETAVIKKPVLPSQKAETSEAENTVAPTESDADPVAKEKRDQEEAQIHQLQTPPAPSKND